MYHWRCECAYSVYYFCYLTAQRCKSKLHHIIELLLEMCLTKSFPYDQKPLPYIQCIILFSKFA